MIRHGERLAAALYGLAIALLLVLLAHNHFQIVSAPFPLDYFEGTMPVITGLIASGRNPYTYAQQPEYAYVYPPLYNIIVAALTAIFGNSVRLHRVVSGCFVLLSCLLLWRAARGAGASAANSAAAAALLYAALLFYSTPIASTNSTGMFFFLASVLIPWQRGFSNRSLAMALACGLLAFYSKQYFGVGIAFVCLFLFLQVSKAKASAFGLAAVLAVSVSLALVHLTSPYFLDNTVFAQFYASRNAMRWFGGREVMLKQLAFFGQTYAGLLAIVLLLLLHGLFRARGRIRAVFHSLASLAWLRLRDRNQPLLACKVDYSRFLFVCSTALIVLMLGRNPGNFMTYLFQLMSPFLLLAVFSSEPLQKPSAILLLPLVLATFYQAYTTLDRDFQVDMGNWRKLDAMIAQNRRILASPMLLAMLQEHGKTVYQDGHTFYFPAARDKPALLEPAERRLQVAVVWDDYLRRLYGMIARKEFDLVLIAYWDIGMVSNPPPGTGDEGIGYFQQFYRLSETVPVSMTKRRGGGEWQMQVWVPK